MEGSECDKFNEQVCSQPMTNADRIRAMSDEELVALLLNNPVCKEMDPYRDRCAVRKCRECLLEWLQQPAKEEANHA